MPHGTQHSEHRALTRSRGRERVGVLTAQLAALAVLAAAAAGTSAASPASVVYVSATGSDAAAGTAAAPLRTIAAGIAKTPAGGTVVVGSGVYHESLVLQGSADRTVTSAPGAQVWLDGSVPVTNWTASGSTWVASGWTASFDSSPTLTAGAPDGTAPGWQFVSPAYPMAAHPDQVFVDGVSQQQVGSATAVGPGEFYVDYGSHTLVLGTNPAGHDVRASDLAKAISIREPGDTVNGINVRRYAPSVPTMGAVTVERPSVTVSNLQVTDNATSGLQVGVPNARLSNLVLARNGMIGLRATRADNLELDRVQVLDNNTEHFNAVPSAGGAKITRTVNLHVTRSVFSDNLGTGLWLDESDYAFSVISNHMTGNADHGFLAEISGRGIVANNVLGGNAGDGIKITDTDRVRIFNNSVLGNGRALDIAQDSRDVNIGSSYRNPALPLTLRSQRLTIRNNILGGVRSGNCVLCVEDTSHRFSAKQLRLKINGNVYLRSRSAQPRWLVVWSRGRGNPAVYTTLRAWQRHTGEGRRGAFVRQLRGLTPSARTAHARTVVRRTALPTPRWLAVQVGVKAGTRHLGAWMR